MPARRRANDVISPLRAFLFAAALSIALVLVLAPVFPGESHVSAGEPAFKTFRINGEVVASKGAALDQSTIDRIRGAGLLKNTLEADAAAAAVIVGVIGASLLALYLYLFQPREVYNLARMVMLGLLVFLWVAAAKVFLSVTLRDNNRLYLGYILPDGTAGMLIATRLDGGLAVAVAALVTTLATVASFYMPDAGNSISDRPMKAVR